MAKTYSNVPLEMRQGALDLRMEQTLLEVQEHMRSHQGTWPSQRRDDNALYQRWTRLRALTAEAPGEVPERLWPLLAVCNAGRDPDPSQSQPSQSQEGHRRERVLEEVLEHMRRHEGAWPSQRGEAGALRKRFDRVREQATDPAGGLSERGRRLLAECEAGAPGSRWTRNERRAHKRALEQRQATLQWACAAWGKEQGCRVPQPPQLQLIAGPANTFVGASPFPGFVNLGSTCYLNAGVQCLFHCERARTAIGALSLVGIPPSAAELRRSLQTLLRLYTEGELHEAVRAN